MTEDQLDFSARWHRKHVRYVAGRWRIPEGVYFVTAALYRWDDTPDGPETILGLAGREGQGWLAVHLADCDVAEFEACLEVVPVGPEVTVALSEALCPKIPVELAS